MEGNLQTNLGISHISSIVTICSVIGTIIGQLIGSWISLIKEKSKKKDEILKSVNQICNYINSIMDVVNSTHIYVNDSGIMRSKWYIARKKKTPNENALTTLDSFLKQKKMQPISSWDIITEINRALDNKNILLLYNITEKLKKNRHFKKRLHQ